MSLLKPAIFPGSLNAAWFDAFCATINHLLTKEMSAVLSMGKLSGPSDIMVMRFAFRLDGEYAMVTIDSTYLLSVHSSHGTWAYRWQDTGGKTTLLEHLLQMNAPYLTGKLNGSRPEVFDEVATVRNITTDIIALRKSMHISKDVARELYDDAFDVYNWEALDEYIGNAMDMLEAVELDTAEWYCHTTYESGIRNFMSSMWPLVRRALQVVVTELGA